MKCKHCGKPIDKTTSTQFEAYDLVFLKGLKLSEVAAMLGVSKQAIQQRISRLLQKHTTLWNPRAKG